MRQSAEKLVAAMKWRTNDLADASIALFFVEAVNNLLSRECDRDRAIEVGAHSFVLEAMRKHPLSIPLLGCGLVALRNHCSGPVDASAARHRRHEVFSAGAVPMALRVAATHKACSGLQMAAAQLIDALLVNPGPDDVSRTEQALEASFSYVYLYLW